MHDEAERLEHAVSDDLVDRMSAALGDPTTDPHGDPIPRPDGSMMSVSYRSLAAIGAGETVVIGRVENGDADLLRYLGTLGLTPGTSVTVLDCQPFHGPIHVHVADGDRVLGYELAGMVLCLAEGATA